MTSKMLQIAIAVMEVQLKIRVKWQFIEPIYTMGLQAAMDESAFNSLQKLSNFCN